MYFSSKIYFPFLIVVQRHIRSTHSLFCVISSDNLAVNLPLFFDIFLRWHVSPLVASLSTEYLITGQYIFLQIIASVLSILKWRRYSWYQFNAYFWSCCGLTILSSYVTISIVFLTPKKETFWYFAHIIVACRQGSSRW